MAEFENNDEIINGNGNPGSPDNAGLNTETVDTGAEQKYDGTTRQQTPYTGNQTYQPNQYRQTYQQNPQYYSPYQNNPNYRVNTQQYANPYSSHMNYTANVTYGQNNNVKQKKPKKTIGIGAVCVMLICCMMLSAICGFIGINAGKKIASRTTKDPGTSTVIPNTDTSKNTSSVVIVDKSTETVSYGSYADVAAAVKDTVVEITTETVKTSSYFGQYITGGAGSGVIIANDGLVLTNYHVISGASKITVRMTDDKEYEAVVVGSDQESDIALLRISATGIHAATIGNSDALVEGQEVIAIGNPLGELGGTVTNGIISALDREVEVDGDMMNLLQTNAAINPGNSGGGLFNMAGELIGVVNAKSSGTGIEGLGFAIPINDAVKVISELSEYGYVRGRVYLGIEYLEIEEVTYQYYYYGYTKPGIYVVKSDLNPSLQKNDRIVAADDTEISDSSDLKAILRAHKVGDVIKMTVVRNGKNVTVEVTCYEYVPTSTQSGDIDFETSKN